MTESERRLAIFKAKHNNARRRWAAGDSFPDPNVAAAYLKPPCGDVATATFMPAIDYFQLNTRRTCVPPFPPPPT